MELLYTQQLRGFCIASRDAEFTPLVMQLKANGHDVYGFGERKTPDPFVNACTTFLYLDSLDDPASPAPAAPPAAKRNEDSKAVGTAANAKVKVEAPLQKAPAKVLAQDAALVTILRGAVEAAAWDDGWASMSAAGSAAKRQASIDPRNYGVRNFPALFETIGLFDIYKGESGHSFVADKRNKDKALRPSR